MPIVLIILILILLVSSIKIVPQNSEGLIETLGRYSRTVSAGPTLLVPFVQRLRKVSLALQPL